MTIKNNYVDKKGRTYDIRNICFDDNNLIFGEYITESKNENDSYGYDTGVYIFKPANNKGKAFRIYKDFKTSLAGAYNDAELIVNLQKKQKNISLTEFPTGIITLNSLIIGQEIPLYEEYITLRTYIKGNQPIGNEIIIRILKIFRELIDNGIIYSDIHAENLLIHPLYGDIKLIDFDDATVKFEFFVSKYEDMMRNLLKLLFELNTKYQLDLDLDNIKHIAQLEEKVLKKGIK
jgi:serine/threonine protein kinase